jgi:hypothetical protein
MGLFKNACRQQKLTQLNVTWLFLFPSPTHPENPIHNLPKTPPRQDLLVTNVYVSPLEQGLFFVYY